MSKSIQSSPTPDLPDTSNELERLRDILFGAQSRTIEERLHALDIRVTQQYQEIITLLQTQEASLRTEIATQHNALREALQENTQASQARDDALHAALQSVEQRLEADKVSRQELGQLLIEMGQQLQRASS